MDDQTRQTLIDFLIYCAAGIAAWYIILGILGLIVFGVIGIVLAWKFFKG